MSEADVYKQGRHRATSHAGIDAITFTYLPDYLADDRAPAVATTLPRTDVPVASGAAGAVLPFFAGLLPEGRRLDALQRAVKASADDEMTLLLAVGVDTTGDVQVVRAGHSLARRPRRGRGR